MSAETPPPDARALPPPGTPGPWLARPPAPGALAAPDPAVAYAFPAPPEEEEAHLWDYWRVLLRHRWTVITTFVAAALIAAVWTFTTRPVFVATATVKIEREEPRVVKFDQVVPTEAPDDYNQTQLQTQYRILQSRTLANRVIALLQLDHHPEFQDAETEPGVLARAQAWAREQLVRWVPVPPPPTPEGMDDLTLASPLTAAFLDQLGVELVKNARLVRVSFESHYPDLAARVANTLVDSFIAQHLDQKVEATRYATQFLAKQMEEARERLEAADTQLNRFLDKHDILFISGSERTGERQDLVTQQLVVLSDALLRARAERIGKESLITQALRSDPDAVPAVLGSPLVAKLKEELVTLEGKSRELGQTFKPEYPRMLRLGETIGEVRRQLREEVRRVVEGLDADYRAALRSETELQKALDDHRGLARRLGANMVEYSLLRRDADTNRELYIALLTRLKETQVSASLLTSNIAIVDRAEVPAGPARPRRGLSLLMGALVGLFGGVGLAFFFEYLDTNIHDAREVESLLRVPILGLVPAQGSLEGRRAWRRRQLEDGDDEAAPFALVAHAASGSALAEAFRNLRTNVLYSAPEQPPRTVMFTSLHQADGKTSLSTNLAVTLAQLGVGEVLLVDADMRHPNLHEFFDVPPAPGLSAFLTGQAELPAVLHPTRVPNLYVVPAGRVPSNPTELLASNRMSQALAVLRERFAHIVIDTPPLFGVSDPMVLAPRVDGVVLVLRHGRAGRDASQRAVRMLASVRARLLGVVLNDVDVRAPGSGAYGYYGYGYYGYGYYAQPAHPGSGSARRDAGDDGDGDGARGGWRARG